MNVENKFIKSATVLWSSSSVMFKCHAKQRRFFVWKVGIDKFNDRITRVVIVEMQCGINHRLMHLLARTAKSTISSCCITQILYFVEINLLVSAKFHLCNTVALGNGKVCARSIEKNYLDFSAIIFIDFLIVINSKFFILLSGTFVHFHRYVASYPA